MYLTGGLINSIKSDFFSFFLCECIKANHTGTVVKHATMFAGTVQPATSQLYVI